LKPDVRKNGLWLWILPAALTWLLLSPANSVGNESPWPRVALFCGCSFFFCFVLAIKTFSTRKERLWGWLFFSGASLGVYSSLLFMGCFAPDSPHPLSEEQIRAQQRQREMDNRARAAARILPRDSSADASMLDLTSFYNALLPKYGDSGSVFRSLQPGIQTWQGIRFDVRGRVVLFDDDVSGIPVHQKCSGIAFVHGTNPGFKVADGSSQFVIHYASGHVETIPLIFGTDMEQSYRFNRRDLGEPLTNSVVWSERISGAGAPGPNVLFFIKKWHNPFPDETVAAIDFKKPSSYLNSFLVAITVDPVKY